MQCILLSFDWFRFAVLLSEISFGSWLFNIHVFDYLDRPFSPLVRTRPDNRGLAVVPGRLMSVIYGLSVDPHNHQLPVGPIGELVERCISMTEVMVEVSFSSEFQAFFVTSCVRLGNARIVHSTFI